MFWPILGASARIDGRALICVGESRQRTREYQLGSSTLTNDESHDNYGLRRQDDSGGSSFEGFQWVIDPLAVDVFEGAAVAIAVSCA